MNPSQGRFCRLYRPVGALLLLLPILFLLLRSCDVQKPVAAVPTVEATHAAPTSVAPAAVVPTAMPPAALATLAPPTAVPIAMPRLNLPSAADHTADGVKLDGTGQPGATVELWEGATKIGTAVVGADGTWSLLAKLGEGAHKLAARTVDAAGNLLNEIPALDITVPTVIALPLVNAPAAADYTTEGVRLSGAGQPGAPVEVWDGAIKIGTALVGADGSWSLLARLSAGAHQLAVRTVDAAGNTLSELPGIAVTVPTAVVLPTLNLPATADYTADGVNLGGTGQPGATVEVWDGTTRVGKVVVGADGTWSLLGMLSEGAHKLAVRTVDVAGAILNELPALEVTVPAAQTAADDLVTWGQEYIVRPGDWLRTLAERFYGDGALYARIVDGTNARAAVDSTFDEITNPNHIWVGQKLWIPAATAGK